MKVQQFPTAFPYYSIDDKALGQKKIGCDSSNSAEVAYGKLVGSRRQGFKVLGGSLLWLNILCPCKIICICWNSFPKGMVLESRAFRKWIGHESRYSWMELMFFKKDVRELSLLPPQEDLTRRQLFVNKAAGSQQARNLLAPCSWTSHSPELWEISLWCLNHPVYDIFLSSLNRQRLSSK